MMQRFHDIKHCIYKRLETDNEFRERVKNQIPYLYATNSRLYAGAELDDYLWRTTKKQRRIIEVDPGPVKT